MKEVTGKDPSEKELERNFQIMDLDKSGDIDKEEAFKFLNDTFADVFGEEPSEEQNEETFKMVDRNGDGVISFSGKA